MEFFYAKKSRRRNSCPRPTMAYAVSRHIFPPCLHTAVFHHGDPLSADLFRVRESFLCPDIVIRREFSREKMNPCSRLRNSRPSDATCKPIRFNRISILRLLYMENFFYSYKFLSRLGNVFKHEYRNL